MKNFAQVEASGDEVLHGDVVVGMDDDAAVGVEVTTGEVTLPVPFLRK